MTPQIGILISKLPVKEDILESGKVEYANVPGSAQTHIAHSALSLNNQPNRFSWLNVKGYKNLKICDSCRCVVKRQGCGTRKFVNFNLQTNLAHVYHMGTHTCTPHLETCRKKKHMAKILQNVDSKTNISGKEIAVNQVEKILETGPMAEVHNEASLWIDYR